MCMDDRSDKRRITWPTRINIKPSAQEAIRLIAKDERQPMATVIGIVIEEYVSARST